MKNKLIIFFLILLISIFSISIVDKAFQNDTFFTIAVGEKIINQGIYTDEDFTWHEGLKYQNVRWMFDVTIANIYNSFGNSGIYIFVLLVTCLFGNVLFYILYNQNKNIFISFIYTLLAMYSAREMFAARAQLFSFFIFVLEYFFLYKLVITNKKIYSVLLLVLSILLANIHASVYPLFFVFYMPYIAEYVLSLIVKNNNENNKVEIKRINSFPLLFITFAITAFGGLVTPIGLAPYVNMFKTVGEISSDIISEMQPLVPIYELPFVLYIAIFIGIVGFTKIKVRIVDCFYLLGFLILSLSTIRSVFFFYLIGIFPIANITAQVFNEYKGNIKINKFAEKAFFIIIYILIMCFSVNNFSSKVNEKYIDETAYPVDAAKFILNNLDISKMKLYNHFNYGSYLELEHIPVFLDSRAEIYLSTFNDTSVLEDYKTITSSDSEYKRLFNKYGVTHALIYNNDVFSNNIYENPEWNLIYLDDNFSIYERIEKK